MSTRRMALAGRFEPVLVALVGISATLAFAQPIGPIKPNQWNAAGVAYLYDKGVPSSIHTTHGWFISNTQVMVCPAGGGCKPIALVGGGWRPSGVAGGTIAASSSTSYLWITDGQRVQACLALTGACTTLSANATTSGWRPGGAAYWWTKNPQSILYGSHGWFISDTHAMRCHMITDKLPPSGRHCIDMRLPSGSGWTPVGAAGGPVASIERDSHFWFTNGNRIGVCRVIEGPAGDSGSCTAIAQVPSP